MPLYDDEKQSYWMLPGYMKMLEAENAIPLMLPLTSKVKELDYFLEICGGFLLTGGHDVYHVCALQAELAFRYVSVCLSCQKGTMVRFLLRTTG